MFIPVSVWLPFPNCHKYNLLNRFVRLLWHHDVLLLLIRKRSSSILFSQIDRNLKNLSVFITVNIVDIVTQHHEIVMTSNCKNVKFAYLQLYKYCLLSFVSATLLCNKTTYSTCSKDVCKDSLTSISQVLRKVFNLVLANWQSQVTGVFHWKFNQWERSVSFFFFAWFLILMQINFLDSSYFAYKLPCT